MKQLKIKDNQYRAKEDFFEVKAVINRVADKTLAQLEHEGVFVFPEGVADAEDLAKDIKYREKYDYCVSRAVANLSTLSEYCLPFVKIGGQFISYKSGDCDEESANAKSAIFLLGGKLNSINKFEILKTDIYGKTGMRGPYITRNEDIYYFNKNLLYFFK